MYTLHGKCMIGASKLRTKGHNDYVLNHFFMYCVYTNLLQTGIKTYSFLKRSTLFVNDDARAYLSSALKKMTWN